MSKYLLGVGIYDLNDNLISKFNNNVQLAKHFYISKVTVGKYLNNGLVYKGILRFKVIQAQYDLFLESELVSGFMTEHSAVIFVFFFLAEYASIVLMCLLTSILFLGGYLSIIPVDILINIFNLFFDVNHTILYDLLVNMSSSTLNLAFKTAILIFVFI